MPTSLWLQESPPPPAALPDVAAGPLPAAADVVVIGAGVAGSCTALQLARAGIAPVVLDAGGVAGRASGRNDGQLLLGLGEHYNRIVGQLGKGTARALWHFIRDNNTGLKAFLRDHEIPCDLREAGGLRLAETDHEAAELAEAAALLRAEGIPHAMLDAAEVAALLPSAGFLGAMRLPGEAIVHPVAMVRGIAGQAVAAGARLYTGTKVQQVAGDAGEFTVTTDRGAIRTGIVVHCTSVLGVDLDGSGFLRRQLFPFRGQIIATDPLPTDLARRFPPLAMSSHFCYEYFRMHRGRFMLGGMRWSVKGEEQGTLDDDTSNPEVTRNLLGYVAQHFPLLDGVGFPHTWTGIMAGTQDGLPLLGALPGHSGVFCNLGYNGYGLSFAWLAGQVLAEQIATGRAEHPAAGLFAPRRFA